MSETSLSLTPQPKNRETKAWSSSNQLGVAAKAVNVQKSYLYKNGVTMSDPN